jgi:hypothetical protein
MMNSGNRHIPRVIKMESAIFCNDQTQGKSEVDTFVYANNVRNFNSSWFRVMGRSRPPHAFEAWEKTRGKGIWAVQTFPSEFIWILYPNSIFARPIRPNYKFLQRLHRLHSPLRQLPRPAPPRFSLSNSKPPPR